MSIDSKPDVSESSIRISRLEQLARHALIRSQSCSIFLDGSVQRIRVGERTKIRSTAQQRAY